MLVVIPARLGIIANYATRLRGGKGGGGGAAVATGNVTVGSFAFNAGVFNSAVSTGVVNNTNASTNIAAPANNSFNK